MIDKLSPTLNSHSDSPKLTFRQTRSLLANVTHGLSSVAKTSVLRRDRVSDAFYRTRLDICKGCPGGHAKFHKNGSLSTCGPMIKSLRDEGQKTCGCVLNKKARDVKESCPLGYWPTLDGAAMQPETSAARDGSLPGVPGLAYDLLTRRHFIGTALGALASAVVVRPSWAAENDACYVTLTACGPNGQSGVYTDCSVVEGWEIGKVYEGGDGECYTLSENPPTNQAGTNQVMLLAGAKEDCQECQLSTTPCSDPACNLPSTIKLIVYFEACQFEEVCKTLGEPSIWDRLIDHEIILPSVSPGVYAVSQYELPQKRSSNNICGTFDQDMSPRNRNYSVSCGADGQWKYSISSNTASGIVRLVTNAPIPGLGCRGTVKVWDEDVPCSPDTPEGFLEFTKDSGTFVV